MNTTVISLIDANPCKIIAICYGTAHIFETRNEAIKFFAAAMNGSDGSEHDRYSTIYEKLCIGWSVVSDNELVFYQGDEFSNKISEIKKH